MPQFNINRSTVGQQNNSGDNFMVASRAPEGKSLWGHVCTWYGLVGTTISIVTGLLGWYSLHVQFDWWFWGVK